MKIFILFFIILFSNRSYSNIVIAVIDTGLDINHISYRNKKNLWVNKGETGKDKFGKDKATNGRDDDNNGYIDDVYGANTIDKNGDISDNHGHGTHITGLILGKNKLFKKYKNNKNIKIMTIKYFNNKDTKNTMKNEIEAFKYAIKNGANIINYSGGGEYPEETEMNLIKKANKKGIHIVVAAGNNGEDLSSSSYYPCKYNREFYVEQICVGNISNNLERVPSSNYGPYVDFFTFGQNLISTVPEKMGNYKGLTGTSQSTAIISGLIAQILKLDKKLTPKESKFILLESLKKNKEKIIEIDRVGEEAKKYLRIKKFIKDNPNL